MLIEHTEPVACVTISFNEAIFIAAQRSVFVGKVLSGRALARAVIGLVIYAGIGGLIGWRERPEVWAFASFGGALIGLLILCLLLYALMPIRVRRLLRQNHRLWKQAFEVRWSTAGLSIRSPHSTTELTWQDYYGWRPARVGFLLFLNSAQFQTIPAASLSEQERDGLRAILERSNLRRL